MFRYLAEGTRGPRTLADRSKRLAPGFRPGLHVHVNKANLEHARMGPVPTRHAVARGLADYSSRQRNAQGRAPRHRRTEKHPCFESSPDSVFFDGFRGSGIEFSTACPHPDVRPGRQRHSGRKGATGPLIRSEPGGPPRNAARTSIRRRPPSCPPTCAGRAARRSR